MSQWAAQHLGQLPGRCPHCGWHTNTQGHDPNCPDNPEPTPAPIPLGNQS